MLCLIRIFILSLDHYKDAFIKCNDCHMSQSTGKSVTLSLSAVGENRQELQSWPTAPGRKHRELVNFFVPSLPNHLSVCAMPTPCHLRLISEGWKFISVDVWKERSRQNT